jgi:hypothetical protein
MLRLGMGQQANISKQGRWWIPELISGTEVSIQNWIAHLAEGGHYKKRDIWIKDENTKCKRGDEQRYVKPEKKESNRNPKK